MFLCSCCTTDTGREVEKESEIVLESQSYAMHPEGFETAGRDSTFTCTVKRDDGEWGMLCDSWGDCIQVVRVRGGKVTEYNDGVHAALQLTPGDVILQVDGKDVRPESLRELKEVAAAEFMVRRPAHSKVKVTKADTQKWGLKMTYQKGRSFCLRVNAVNDGAVKDYNYLSAHANSQIKPADFILSVNGCQDDPQKMLEMLRGSSDVDLTIMRLA